MSDMRKKNFLWAVLCSALYIALLWNLIPFVYGIIDDRSMMEIVSGQYLGSPDAHAIFLGWWYSLALSGLYRLMPEMDWYALCYLLLQGACISLILFRLLEGQKEKWKKIFQAALVLLIFTALALQAMTQLTFTTTAAVLGMTVIFWYATSERIRLWDWLILFILAFLTEQVRSSVFFMILPVCGILWIFRVRKASGRTFWNLMIPLAVAAVFALRIAGNQAGYGSDSWRAYESYNQNRSAVYDYSDYTFPLYEGAEDFYESIGIEKKSRARTLINYNYTADERITPEFFGAYIDAYKNAFPSETTRAAKLKACVKEYLKGILSGRFHLMHILALLLYAALIVWYLAKKEWEFCWKAIGVGGIQGLLWLYLLYEGRTPDRVIFSMNLMLTVTALLLWLEAIQRIRPETKLRKAGAAAALAVFFLLALTQIRAIRQQNLKLSDQNENVEALKEYCMEHPENFYFNDVTSMAFTTWNVRLWNPEPYVMNYMSLGDWMSYSPVWQEKLAQKGITSVKDALYGQNDVYLICSFDKGLEYLISLYDNTEAVEIDKIPGFKIYRLQFL